MVVVVVGKPLEVEECKQVLVLGKFSYNDEDKLVVVEGLVELAYLEPRVVLEVLEDQNIQAFLEVQVDQVVHCNLEILVVP